MSRVDRAFSLDVLRNGILRTISNPPLMHHRGMRASLRRCEEVQVEAFARRNVTIPTPRRDTAPPGATMYFSGITRVSLVGAALEVGLVVFR